MKSCFDMRFWAQWISSWIFKSTGRRIKRDVRAGGDAGDTWDGWDLGDAFFGSWVVGANRASKPDVKDFFAMTVFIYVLNIFDYLLYILFIF